jgi:hypothetical protein
MQDSLKRKLLAGGIAGALVLGAGAVAGAATGVGPFDDSGPKLEHGTEVGDETTTTTSLDQAPGAVPAPDPSVSDDPAGHDANDDNGIDDPASHDANDDNTGHDNSGPGSDNSGPGSGSSGHGSDDSGSEHD